MVIHSLVISFGQVSMIKNDCKRLFNNEILKLYSKSIVTNNHSKLDI